jgi:hypothetical protein
MDVPYDWGCNVALMWSLMSPVDYRLAPLLLGHTTGLGYQLHYLFAFECIALILIRFGDLSDSNGICIAASPRQIMPGVRTSFSNLANRLIRQFVPTE